ncbi:MAG: hypothetical protein KGD57_08760 [Candidatus Lokiarchaeota archaeon]|nr:hypothetical protein [Candidatus Lokiarchaeota archaeon]
MNWIKLDIFHLGISAKKHQIFRASKWNINLEKIIKKPLYNEEYTNIGFIKDIFGPVKTPFISVKTKPNQLIDSKTNFYVKLK